MLTIDQQRERERQHIREEDERRRKLLVRKDYPHALVMPIVPKFEPLAVDVNHDESHRNKSKTPTTMMVAPLPGNYSPHVPPTNSMTNRIMPGKPATSIPSLPRINMPTNHETNALTSNDAVSTSTAAAIKKFVIKRRSSVLVSCATMIVVYCSC
jgi:hypothetical protein